MKRFIAWVYECEYCKKRGRSASHMKHHERHCTRNIDRKCRMCDRLELVQQPMADLVAALGPSGDNIDSLRKAADDCPVCMLAALKQTDHLRGDGWWWWDGVLTDRHECHFDFKAETKRAFEIIDDFIYTPKEA